MNNYSFREDWQNWLMAGFAVIAAIITLIFL